MPKLVAEAGLDANTLAGDAFDLGACEAKITQFAIGKLGEFPNRGPVATPSIELFCNRLEGHKLAFQRFDLQAGPEVLK